jgi:hypothetical protein
MFVDVMMRRRGRVDEPIPALNAALIEQFMAVPGFWGEGKTAADAPLSEGEAGSSLDLRKSLRDGLSGQAIYIARFPGYMSKDVARADDTMRVRLNTDKIDHATFCTETLPRLITIFGSYRGYVETDAKVRAADWDVVRQQSRQTGRNIDGRDGIFRIWPVCWFDEELSRRTFAIGVEEAVRRAAPECERAEVVAGCAFLIVTSAIVTGANLDVINARIKSRLGAGTTAQLGAA